MHARVTRASCACCVRSPPARWRSCRSRRQTCSGSGVLSLRELSNVPMCVIRRASPSSRRQRLCSLERCPNWWHFSSTVRCCPQSETPCWLPVGNQQGVSDWGQHRTVEEKCHQLGHRSRLHSRWRRLDGEARLITHIGTFDSSRRERTPLPLQV